MIFFILTADVILCKTQELMAKVAQLVRVSVCGTECREFESHLSPQCKAVPEGAAFVLGSKR